MDIQILDIAELLLFVFMICTCIRIYRQKKNIVKNVNYVFDKPYILCYGNRN